LCVVRDGRREHIGARAELDAVVKDIGEVVRMLDGLNRYRFGADPGDSHEEVPPTSRYAAVQNRVTAAFLGIDLALRQLPIRQDVVLAEMLQRDPTDLKRSSRKSCEDSLDALFCAYLAYHYWRYGPSAWRLFGTPDEG
jgi:hypothetical protein